MARTMKRKNMMSTRKQNKKMTRWKKRENIVKKQKRKEEKMAVIKMSKK